MSRADTADKAGEIKRLVPMTQAATFYGLEVRGDGFCRCPFHGEKTASMKVYDGERGWHCFGCHEGGSVIDFVMKLFGLSFVDAEKRLSDDFRLDLFTDDQDPQARQKARIAATERKKALEERDRQHLAVWRRYSDALEAFANADKLVNETMQRPPREWLSRHHKALQEIDRLWYELKDAEAALSDFERENHVSGPPRPGGEKPFE
jgi:hypothetical protein